MRKEWIIQFNILNYENNHAFGTKHDLPSIFGTVQFILLSPKVSQKLNGIIGDVHIITINVID
jgi:hypothetical protein